MEATRKAIWIFLYIMLGIMVCMMLFGCSQQYHLKRSKQHLEKAIAKGYELQYDTTFINDTIRIESVKLDTFLRDVGDTIILKKDRLKVIYKRDTITNEVFISGECEADTIIKEIPVQVQKPIYIEQTPLEWAGIDKWWEKLLFYIAIGACILLITLRFIASYAR